MSSEHAKLKLLMFPWLAYGHISPFLELAKRLSDRNFHIYLCSTPINLSSITKNKKIPDRYSDSIQLVQLNLPSLPDLPPQHHTTNGLPCHLQPVLKQALELSKPEFSRIVKDISPDLLIHDVMFLWVPAIAFSLNIPYISFNTSGATMLSYFCHCAIKPGIEFPFEAIRLTHFEQEMINGKLRDEKNENKEEEPGDDQVSQRSNETMLINTTGEMEGKYIDYLSGLLNRRIVSVGSFIADPDQVIGNDENELVDWLDTKSDSSTVFVSFGTEYFLKKDEIEEVAYGLELSNVNFIWVIRFPLGDNIGLDEALPEGFVNRVSDRGRVVKQWAPQARILGHPSVGGFVSHCGWNSILESIQFEVPVIAMPIHLDQPINAKLMAELGVAVEVKRDDSGKFRREEIAKMIKDVVFGETGESLRRKVGEQREKIRSRSEEEIVQVVHELELLCGKNKGTTSLSS